MLICPKKLAEIKGLIAEFLRMANSKRLASSRWLKRPAHYTTPLLPVWKVVKEQTGSFLRKAPV